MDAYSKYEQIHMYKPQKEITFITRKGLSIAIV